MELLRFDPGAGHHVDQFGSDFVLAGLVRTSETARVDCFHLGPGGLVGRHRAVDTQLFCVVLGEGWVTGDDDRRVDIAVGQAALWSPGEMHAAGTDTRLVAVVVEGPGLRVLAPP